METLSSQAAIKKTSACNIMRNENLRKIRIPVFYLGTGRNLQAHCCLYEYYYTVDIVWLNWLDETLKPVLLQRSGKVKRILKFLPVKSLTIRQNYYKLKDVLSGWKEVIFPFVVCVQGAVNLIIY
jgi:hypothetical protein